MHRVNMKGLIVCKGRNDIMNFRGDINFNIYICIERFGVQAWVFEI
jgi:hypothetical protein